MSTMAKIIIAGANGFIGSNILRWFEENDGFSPAGLVRKTSDLKRLSNTDAPIIHYPENKEKLSEILKGTLALINTAGKASYRGDYRDFYHANVQVPLDLIEASIKAGVAKFIHISSTVVYGFNGNINTNENKKPQPYKNHYCTTKKICEEKLLEYSEKINLYLFRPATVYGPWDFSFTYSLMASLEKGLKLFPGGGKTLTSPCFVKNLAYGIECALKDKGNPGVYNISDGNDMRWIDFLKLFSKELNADYPRIGIPCFPIHVIFKTLEIFSKLTGIKLPEVVSTALIAQVSKDYSFSIDKLIRRLRYKPIYSTRMGVKESISWYLEQKFKMPSREFP